MGGTITKCITKKHKNKYVKRENNSINKNIKITENNGNFNVNKNIKINESNENLNIDRYLNNQFELKKNSISNSERNFLNEVRKEKIERPQGVFFKPNINGRRVVRMASWNLKNLTIQKLKNHGAILVICLTILENNISVITLQEVADEEVAKLLCFELNKAIVEMTKCPELGQNWNYSNSSKPTGRMFQRNEYGIIIYDSSQNISILQIGELTVNTIKERKVFSRDPFFVNLKIDETAFLLATFHIKAKGFSEGNSTKTADELNDLAVLAKALKGSLKPGHKVIFMGDFNESPVSPCFQALKDENYIFCIDGLLATNVGKSNSKCYDNIWINKSCEYFYTGLSGVITVGLTHPFIPKDDMNGWGGSVSDHCPVWADFFVQG